MALLGYYVEPTNVCNLHCPTCANRASLRPTGFMSWELFQRAIHDRPCENVMLYFGGEPLLHPDIAKMACYAQRFARCRIATNGQLLTADLARQFVDGGVSQISFSLDTADAESYRRVRGGPLGSVIRNIQALHRIRGAAPLPKLTVEVIRYPHLPDQLPGVLEALQGHCDEIASKKFLEYPLLSAAPAASVSPCWQVSQFVAVLWDGRVTPCCLDLGAACVVGDLSQQPMTAILHSPAMKAVHVLCQQGRQDLLSLCRTCHSVATLNGNPYWATYNLPGTMAGDLSGDSP